jgi:hypothetical protein
MDAPDSPPPPPPAPRRFSRRGLFRLAGAGALLGVSAEAARVLFGSNEHTVIPGKVYRSGQLSRRKLERVLAEKHIRTVVNLRGCCPGCDWYNADAQATHAAGVSLEDLSFSAKRYPAPGELIRLVEVYDRTEYPILMHCAAGADRTGLASALAVLLLTDADLATGRRQLWPRYGHFGSIGRTGVLDGVLDAYEAKLAAGGETHSPARLRKWLAAEYCPGPYRAELSVVAPVPLTVPVGVPFTVTIRATNRSVAPWRFTPGGSGGVWLRYWLTAPPDELVYRGHAGHLARTVHPGESIDLVCGFPPVARPGPCTLNADLIDALPIDLLDSAFAQYGSEALSVNLTVVRSA